MSKCECVKKVNEKLKEHGVALKQQMTVNVKNGTMGFLAPLIETERLGSGKGRKKVPILTCSFCPFCGNSKVEATGDE